MSKTIKGHLLALFVCLCWGTSFIISKTLMGHMTPIQLIWLRFGFAWIALWAFYPKWHVVSFKEEGTFFLMSIFSNTLYFLAENTALTYTQTTNVAIITATIPLMVALLLRIFRGQKMGPNRVVGSLVAFIGVIFVIFNGVFVLKLGGLGDVLALGAVFSWSMYSFLISNKAGKYNSFLLSRKLMFYGFLTMTPIMLLSGAPMNLGVMLGEGRIFGLLYLAVICSALCYALWNNAIRDLGINATNMYLYTMPLFTLLGSAIVLKEQLTWLGILGMITVITGLLFTNLQKNPFKTTES